MHLSGGADVLYLPEAPCWLSGGAALPDGGPIEGFCARHRMHEKVMHVCIQTQ